MATDPGLGPQSVGGALQRVVGQPVVDRLPLRLLVPVTDAEIQANVRGFVRMCAEMVRRRLDSSEGS